MYLGGGIGRTLQNFLYRSSGATDFPLLESQLFFFSPSFSPQIPEHDQDRQTFSGCYTSGITLEKVDLFLRRARQVLKYPLEISDILDI